MVRDLFITVRATSLYSEIDVNVSNVAYYNDHVINLVSGDFIKVAETRQQIKDMIEQRVQAFIMWEQNIINNMVDDAFKLSE